MADLIFVLIVLGFFGLMVLLVKACDRIIGPDGPNGSTTEAAQAPLADGSEQGAEHEVAV